MNNEISKSNWNMRMDIGAILTILAVLISPLLAVQVTRLIDVRNDRHIRKMAVFRALMTTRASVMSPMHVEALNSIDLEFGGNSRGEKDIRIAWKACLAHLGNQQMSMDNWHGKRVDLLLELLFKMGQFLGYGFDKTDLQQGIYSPVEHGQIEGDQRAIRIGLREILSGQRSIPIEVKNLNTDPITKIESSDS